MFIIYSSRFCLHLLKLLLSNQGMGIPVIEMAAEIAKIQADSQVEIWLQRSQTSGERENLENVTL